MRCAILLLVCLGATVWGGSSPVKIDDHELLLKQKDILRLLMHVHLPNVFEDQIRIAQTWNIESNLALYENPALVKEFVLLFKVGLLKRGEIFSIYNDVHRRQAIALFNVLYFAKTYEIFYNTACWARDIVNERMYVYALSLAVLHRPDLKGVILPPIYEIIPHFFVHTDVINKAYRYKMTDFAYVGTGKVDTGYVKSIYDKVSPRWDLLKDKNVIDPELIYTQGEHELTWNHMPRDVVQQVHVPGYESVVIIPSNYTNALFDVDVDQDLAYFLEDVGLNALYYYMHLISPFWMDSDIYKITKEHRGELYYVLHQQLLARLYLERLSNGLPAIDLLDTLDVLPQKYIPFLTYENGIDFPVRVDTQKIVKDSETLLWSEEVTDLEQRILDSIELGFIFTEDGKKVPLFTEGGIDILGNLIEGNADSINLRFFKRLHIIMKLLVGRQLTTFGVNSVPSTLEHYETMLRDPAFWIIYKKIVILMDRYKKLLPAYTYDDLFLPGVKIESVTVDKLITYFDKFDIELNNGIMTNWIKEKDSVKTLMKARQMRLNHKPFNVRLNVVSDRKIRAVVRVFIGPKYDEQGRLIKIEDNRHNFVLLDKFVKEIPAGKSVIERVPIMGGRVTVPRTSFLELYRGVMGALQGQGDLVVDSHELYCGFPRNLILPKGRRGGMPFQMFFMITPLDERTTELPVSEKVINKDTLCGLHGEPWAVVDQLPINYPFDRPIDVTVFRTPNMYYKDVMIFHKRLDEVVVNVTH